MTVAATAGERIATDESSSPTRLELLMCVDDGFARHAAVALRSVAATTPGPMRATVVSPNFTADTRARLAAALADLAEVELRLLDFDLDRLADLPGHRVYPPDIYIRLWMEEFFEDDVARVLYLDADVVCRRSLRPLWELDLGERVLAAVPIPGATSQDRCGLPPGAPYVNSGVLLVDLRRWRERRVLARLVDFLHANAERVRNPDQDALNGCLADDMVRLDYRWNAITPFYRDDPRLGLGRERMRRVRDEACIVHFNGGSKPWLFMDRHPCRPLYWAQLRRTPWRDYRPPDRTLVNALKKAVASVVPRRWLRRRHRARRA
jgi:lipopolysaccharide biosynthesis glycosyltransferase